LYIECVNFSGTGSLTILRKTSTSSLSGVVEDGGAQVNPSKRVACDGSYSAICPDTMSSEGKEGGASPASESPTNTSSDLSRVDSLPPADTTEALRACSARWVRLQDFKS